MTKKIKYIFAGLVFMLAACTTEGPQKTLDELASALENNNSSAFISFFDMGAFANNHIKNMTVNDGALSSLNALGNMFGLGNLDELIGSVVDMKSRLSQQFMRGVASGEIVAQCRNTDTPECPWVPQSLRSAKIVEIGPDAAIAHVVTPAHLASWLAFSKKDNKWLVVGQAIMEDEARAMATAGVQPAPQVPSKNAKPVKPAVEI